MQRNRRKQQNKKIQRSLQENWRSLKGTFHTWMGMIQDRHGKDLTEVEEIEKRRQEYTE